MLFLNENLKTDWSSIEGESSTYDVIIECNKYLNIFVKCICALKSKNNQ